MKNKKALALCATISFTLLSWSFMQITQFYKNQSTEKTILEKVRLKNTESLACATPNIVADITCVADGPWTSPSTWSTGSVPSSADQVTIGAGRTVTLSGVIEAKSIVIQGTVRPLTMTTDFSITTQGILIDGVNNVSGANAVTATLEIGTDANNYFGKATITLTGGESNLSLFGSMMGGTKAIIAANNGVLSMHGKNKVTWTTLGANANVAATQLTLSNPVEWNVGDEIVVSSSRMSWLEAEKRTITAISPDKLTVTVSAGLTFPHTGVQQTYTRPTDGKSWTVDLRAEVGLLTHNITIQGDAASDTDGFGGHIMIHSNGKGFVKNIELFRMGQRKRNGRYPFHWHLLVGAGAGQYFSSNTVHKSFNRAITVHGTHNTLVEDNYMYDHVGHGVFLEDGSEINNTFSRNVVLLTKKPAIGDHLTATEDVSNRLLDAAQNRSPASFWITNPNNTFEDNIAAGTQGTGFWYAMPFDFMGDSKLAQTSNGTFAGQTVPIQERNGGFNRNKTHSSMNGFDMFDGLTPGHALVANAGWQNPDMKFFDNNTFYANDNGIYVGTANGRQWGEKVTWRNSILVENNFASQFATYSIIDESLYVANTGLNLNPNFKAAHRLYDGPATVKNSYMVGFNASDTDLVANFGASDRHANTTFDNITYNHATPVNISQSDFTEKLGENYNVVRDFNKPLTWMTVFWDPAGSLSGVANSSVIGNHPFLLVGDEQTKSNWKNMHYTPRRYINTRLNADGIDIMPLMISRTKPNIPSVHFYDPQVFADQKYSQFSAIVNDGWQYTVNLSARPASKLLLSKASNAFIGDVYMVRYKNFGKLGGLTVTTANIVQGIPSPTVFVAHTSLASFNAGTTTGYFIEPNGDLYVRIKFVTKDEGFFMRWQTDYTNTPNVDTDGDGYTDLNEVASGKRTPNTAKDLAFDFATTKDGWQNGANIASDNNIGGSWNVTANAATPDVVRTGLNFESYNIKDIILETESSTAGNYKFYWTTSDDATFSESKSVTVPYSTVGTRAILAFPVSTNSLWTNKVITSFKIVVPGGNAITTKLYDIYTGEAGVDDDGDGISNYDEVLMCRNPKSASDFSINFDTAKDAESRFTTNVVKDYRIANGIFSGEASGGGDTQLTHEDDFNFSGTVVPKVQIKLKVSANVTLQLFWRIHNPDPVLGNWNGSTQVKGINVAASTDWQIITLDMSSNANWAGQNIKNLRLDVVNIAGVTWEVDWIRSENYVDCSCSTGTKLIPLTTDGGWTYYGPEKTNDYRFAIEHIPAGGNTTPFTAEVIQNADCKAAPTSAKILNSTLKQGTLVAPDYYNVKLLGGSTNGNVNVRIFSNNIVTNALETETTAFATSNGAGVVKSNISFFNLEGQAKFPDMIRTDGRGLNAQFLPLTSPITGFFDRKGYVQFSTRVASIGSTIGQVTQVISTTAAEPVVAGTLRYNSTTHKFEGFNGTTWTPLH